MPPAVPAATNTAPPARPPCTRMRPAPIDLTANPASVALARRFVRDVVSGHLPDSDDVITVVSELVANAINAANDLADDTGHPWRPDDHPIALGIIATDRWTHIAVRDPSRDEPTIGDEDLMAENGRGMVIVHALAAALWVRHARFYKVVHALIPHPGVTLTREEIKAVQG